MRILFWGTPEFATPSLRALIGEGFDVVGVVTQPDKPHGRSRSQLVAPPIKEIAVEEDIPVFQPENPKTPAFLADVRALEADASVVVAYGHIISQALIDTPRLGTFNVHASLLPHLRGAAPIQMAIREGLPETGITIMRLVPALDAGPIILQLATPIVPDETAGELQLRLSELGAQALIEGLALLEFNAARERPQVDAEATYAKKIDRASTIINWSATALTVSRMIRAYDPRPGALTHARENEVKLFGVRIVPGAAAGAPGTVVSISSEGMGVACGSGAIRISQVQPAGKARMSPDQWANGRGIAVGDRLS